MSRVPSCRPSSFENLPRSCKRTITFCIVLAGLFVAKQTSLCAEELQPRPTTVLVAADHRQSISLDGPWHYIVDPYGNGLYDGNGKVRNNGFAQNAKPTDKNRLMEYSFAKSPTLQVPGDWNTQKDSLFFYEGPLWYEKDFSYHKPAGKRVFLHLGAANYRSFLWINGEHVCDHEGGFTSFDCEVTQALKDGDNFAVIAVDNTRVADGIPTLKTDWWNYGGLTREVALVEVPEQFVDDFDLHLKRGTKNVVEGWAHVEGAPAGTEVKLTIGNGSDLGMASAKTGADGGVQFDLRDEKLQLWSPEHPTLYHVTLSTADDKLEDDMGFRTIETRGTQILLNGQAIFLKGINIHAEAPIRTGRAYSEKDAETLLGWAHELGVNFVRLAHYPHSERMTRLADKMGILVWSEIPVYWACHFDDPLVLVKAQAQLAEMIRRDRDKASVILWSVANETPGTAPRTKFLSTLVQNAHQQDSSRLVTAALLVRGEGDTKIVDDALGNVLDVIGTNEYVGWYERTPPDADHIRWDIRFQKPVIMSEFGGGARAGNHGDATTRWTEEFQESIYEHQLVMLSQIPQLRGMTPWVLMDFRSPLRQLPEMQDYFNRKGVISPEGQKKKAFYVLQKAYKENIIGHAE